MTSRTLNLLSSLEMTIDLNIEAVPRIVEDSFLNALMIMADTKDVVSIDMFDTLVTRRVTSPVDVFAEVEKRLGLKYGSKVEGFAKEREAVERQLYSERGDTGHEDVTLDMIYSRLTSYPSEAKQTEMDAELDVLVASKDLLKFTRQLNVLGKPWIVVSDMYLPGEFLAKALTKCGFSGWKKIYVSGDLGATKNSGSIWKLHIGWTYPLDTILHVGDNAHSDLNIPLSLGITVLPYNRLRTVTRTGAQLDPHLLPYSYLNRDLELNMIEDATEDDQWQHLGRTMGAIFISAFIKWIVERAKATGIKRLYFCARDGHLLHRVWNLPGSAIRFPGIEARYLDISRAPLQIARGYLESNPNWLCPQLIDFLIMVDEKTTVETIQRRISSETNSYLDQDLRKEFPTIIMDRPWGEAMAALRVILSRYSEWIYEAIRPIAERTKAYLLQEGLGEDIKSAVVDTGWHANQQRCISTIVDRQVSGLYLGLWRKALGAIPKAGFAEGAYSSPFAHQGKEEVSELMMSVNIIESLFTSCEGSTFDYKLDTRSRWIAVTRTNDLEYQQYCTKVKWFQQGVMDVVSEIFNGRKYATLSLEDCTLEAGRSALSYVCMGPTWDQLQLIGGLNHAFLSDHDNTQTLIDQQWPVTDDQANAVLATKGWVFGVLLNWYAMAPIPQKGWIRRMVNERLGNLNERRLRPFWK